jgi:hypothetical protein
VQFGRVVEIFIAVPRMVMAAAVGAVFRLERRFDGSVVAPSCSSMALST